jgi:hypothetical protein
MNALLMMKLLLFQWKVKNFNNAINDKDNKENEEGFPETLLRQSPVKFTE